MCSHNYNIIANVKLLFIIVFFWLPMLNILIYTIFICFASSDIGGRSLSSPNAGIHRIIPCNSWFWTMQQFLLWNEEIHGIIPCRWAATKRPCVAQYRVFFSMSLWYFSINYNVKKLELVARASLWTDRGRKHWILPLLSLNTLSLLIAFSVVCRLHKFSLLIFEIIGYPIKLLFYLKWTTNRAT